ncbi:hypothetical protein AVEN_70317-1 [Araneus ventricosus]|uniref:Uncharacterized protein n=1 Tax=Araneus ventricosus TaxID=182803 RepID=A0A4Y2WGW9_ARAVE|nr:hypothetical protein AVEN_70317-1 [Araneus ventricosus]
MLNLKDKIDPIEYEKFTKDGYFTVRLTDKFWSGIRSNQTIEQTLMKTMKSSGELTRGRGITESVLTRWTLGMMHLHNISEEVEKYSPVMVSGNGAPLEEKEFELDREVEESNEI